MHRCQCKKVAKGDKANYGIKTPCKFSDVFEVSGFSIAWCTSWPSISELLVTDSFTDFLVSLIPKF